MTINGTNYNIFFVGCLISAKTDSQMFGWHNEIESNFSNSNLEFIYIPAPPACV